MSASKMLTSQLLFFFKCNIGDLFFLFFFFLQTLATSQGNILENKDLIESLNQTKASSALIQESLAESHRLQSSLDQVDKKKIFYCCSFPAEKSYLVCVNRVYVHLQERKIRNILNSSFEVRDTCIMQVQKAFSVLKCL